MLLPKWITKNTSGFLICTLCTYFVIQSGYYFICTNKKCEKHYDLPAEKTGNENYIAITATSVSLSGTGAETDFYTTTTLQQNDDGDL